MENSNWQTVKLGEYASFVTGKLDSNAATPDGKYPFFTCSRETFRTDTFSFDTECVLLAGNNAAGIFPLKYFVGKFDAYQRTYIIEPLDRKKLSTRFLYYVLRLQLEYMKSISTGAATKFLTKTILDNIEISIPEFETQRRIADILSAYDDLIENNTRRIRILEQMAQAIYQEWFRKVDKESLPEGWSISKFIDVCNELIDGDWIETKDQGGEDYRLLQVSNIGLGDFVETGNFRYVTQETFERLNCNEIIPGDILISRMPKPIGRGWLVTKMPWRMITAVDVAIARPNPDLLNNYYCIHWLNSSETLAKSEQHASGTTRPRITRRDLAGFEMVIPPIELQNKFGKIAKQLYELQTNLRRKNDNLRQTRDLLLPRLVSGEVEV